MEVQDKDTTQKKTDRMLISAVLNWCIAHEGMSITLDGGLSITFLRYLPTGAETKLDGDMVGYFIKSQSMDCGELMTMKDAIDELSCWLSQ